MPVAAKRRKDDRRNTSIRLDEASFLKALAVRDMREGASVQRIIEKLIQPIVMRK